MAEKKKGPAENDSAELKPVVSIPTIDYFEKTYGRSMEGNDQKAVKVFAEYETKEKIRRLQNELIWVKEGRVPDTTLKAIVGGKRKARYQGYNEWASRMLLWLAAKR